jgi:signal transduction histidine kinase
LTKISSKSKKRNSRKNGTTKEPVNSGNVKFRRLQSEFVTATSHQFRTPLSTIRSSLDLLDLYIKKENTTRQQEIIEKLKRSVGYLTEMVEKITAIYRYDSVKQKARIKKTDVRKFVSDVLNEVVVNISAEHFINSNIEENISSIYCDEFILKQILINLINNSIKFSPKGGQIRLNVSSSKKVIEFSVKDEGIGISKADLKKLFQPFFRGSNAAEIQGVGLGLSIVKNLSMIHKAKIECLSELNRGTEFKISIPTKYKRP